MIQLVIYFNPVGKFHPGSKRGCKRLLLYLQTSRNPVELEWFTIVSAYSIVCICFLYSNQVTAEILVKIQFFFLDYLIELFPVKTDLLLLWWGFTLRLSKGGSTLLEAMKVYQV